MIRLSGGFSSYGSEDVETERMDRIFTRLRITGCGASGVRWSLRRKQRQRSIEAIGWFPTGVTRWRRCQRRRQRRPHDTDDGRYCPRWLFEIDWHHSGRYSLHAKMNIVSISNVSFHHLDKTILSIWIFSTSTNVNSTLSLIHLVQTELFDKRETN